jgi:hypothetical protein
MTMQVSKKELSTIWYALHCYREECIPEGGDPEYDDEWDEICTIMSKIQEQLKDATHE